MNTYPGAKKAIAIILLSFVSSQLLAQQAGLHPYAPSAAEMVNAYQLSTKLDTALRNIPTNNDLIPFWKKDGSAFWYKKNLPNRTWEYYYVDAATGKRKPAFDNNKLAENIEKITGKKQNSLKLQFAELYFADQGNTAKLKIQDKWYELNLSDYSLADTKDTTIYRYNAKRPLQQSRSRWQRNVKQENRLMVKMKS
jgi:hypothetical protein